MKIYSTYHRKDIQVSNTMKSEIIIENKVSGKKTPRVKRSQETTLVGFNSPDSWLSYVSRRMQILRERVSEFFLVETID
ncbi:MAG: hypothetical protein CVU11_10855 [Bacteroidetes bacterium HGW-Bacteroidetes-6]|jgi:hypothetical protein|nr:MAG: hypothetical protein CVU11_10855 [Bacteroidetes bacterium HGW-Bacteroidetes-6]